MNEGTLIVLLIGGWLAVVWYAGKFAVRATGKRWVRWPAMLIVLWLPLWDVVPGFIMYRKAIQELGGVRIYQRVTAEGYLQERRPYCNGCWGELRSSPYRYMELEITGRSSLPGDLVALPGFYQFEFDPESSTRCASLDGAPGATFLRTTIPTGECLVVTRRDAPISRYEYEISQQGWRPLDQAVWFKPVEISWIRIRDRRTGMILAEANWLRYVSWLGKRILIPRWEYTQTEAVEPLWFRVEDVVKPAKVVTK